MVSSGVATTNAGAAGIVRLHRTISASEAREVLRQNGQNMEILFSDQSVHTSSTILDSVGVAQYGPRAFAGGAILELISSRRVS
jgi:hypothetical protein